MRRELRGWGLPSSLVLALLSPATSQAGATRPERLVSPLFFFEGATQSDGTLSVAMHKPTSTRSSGIGAIAADGSLSLVQHVQDQGTAPHMRHWVVQQIFPGHFTGSMSEATSPVTIDQVGNRYRFRFTMRGALSVEEWLTPLAGGRSASDELSVRKFGIEVASSRGMIRKVD